MNHGGDVSTHGPPPITGPREPHVVLGFAATKHTGNVLRLLESSHGSFFYNTLDSLSTVWHRNSQSWTKTSESSVSSWKPVNPIQALSEGSSLSTFHQASSSPLSPRLCSMNFSDERTALVKLRGQDGQFRYLQLLRLDGDAGAIAGGGMAMLPNDGWVILQEVVVERQNEPPDSSSWNSLQSALFAYLDVEHGGGEGSHAVAKSLFHPESKLMSVGIDDVESPPTEWTAPIGSLNLIPLDVYLAGVQSQTPHHASAKVNDAIVSIDYMNGADAAAATVRVGNGAQTMVFEDHLLLGRNSNPHDNNDKPEWTILSKTFSPQKWGVPSY